MLAVGMAALSLKQTYSQDPLMVKLDASLFSVSYIYLKLLNSYFSLNTCSVLHLLQFPRDIFQRHT